MDEQIRQDVTKPWKKQFFKVEDLNQLRHDGKVPALVKNAFWEKSGKTSDIIARKQLKDASAKNNRKRIR